ncbi:MFS transporter [Compostimonas suwonensis]|uniref:Putative MFS family arabinose efflux permease n=1 Tax=Compostimonas suwonensis TaxID=1048394 RepID=A0A2M9BB04_9MICO|nr:MFS transporter [Compostimonas suwonensis]PJJ55122.1 putative MFS family arabinose efflux permease [Compostimonas suwonensis]
MAGQKLSALIESVDFAKTHRRVWLLSSMGIMLDGFDFFIMGVAIPLIAHEWNLTPWETGLASSAAIVGAIVGAAVMGPVSDRIGRKLAFRIDLAMFVVFALLSALAPSLWWLVAFRFLLGVGIGADYPISSSYVSEIAPSRLRTRLLVATFSFQAVGQILGVLVGLAILTLEPTPDAWRWMLGAGVVPAIVIVWLRRGVPESPQWLAATNQLKEAAAAMSVFCERLVTVEEIRDEEVAGALTTVHKADLRDLFSKRYRKSTLLTSVPWFLMDIATYGVGVFTPTILAAIALSPSASTQFIADDITSTEGAALLDLFLVFGFATALLTIARLGAVVLQSAGFFVMAGGLLVLAIATTLTDGSPLNLALVLIGFAAFNFFMNAGPNATTFLMPTEAFPAEIRGSGSGIAAASGKVGAAVGTLFFPILTSAIGLSTTLVIIAAGCAVAAVLTITLRSAVKPRVPAMLV